MRNSVRLIGRLGNDPEVKIFDQSKKASFSIATKDSYKDTNGQKVETTMWHQVVAWGKLAEIVEKFLKKGQEVALEGKLIHRSYAKDNEKRYVTEINLNQVVMLASKS